MSDDELEPDEPEPVVLPVPRKRPIATQKQFRAWLKRVETDMLSPPWYVVARFYYLRKGELPSPDGDETCYACSISYSQYHRIEVRVCPDHPNWSEERDIVTCLRHEVAHGFFGALNDVLVATVPAEVLTNPGVKSLLENAEDTAVNLIATMPVFSRCTQIDRTHLGKEAV